MRRLPHDAALVRSPSAEFHQQDIGVGRHFLDRSRCEACGHTLGARDLVPNFSWLFLKGVGKVYLQTVIDCFSRYAWGRLYANKLPVTAIHVI